MGMGRMQRAAVGRLGLLVLSLTESFDNSVYVHEYSYAFS